jgi:DNA-binding response OmpR family regulator
MPSRQRILIVDDDPGLRDALTEQLSLHQEFEALAVENGSNGVQAAKAGQIDLVFMDVGCPTSTAVRRCASCARTALRLRSSC